MTYSFIDKGSGRTIIMLHGMFGRSANWQPLIDRISGNFRTVALEVPYLDLITKECDMKDISDYVLGFLDSKGLKKVIFMGNSLGGHIALDIAVKKKERVESLVLTGSSGLFERSYEKDLEIHPTKPYVRKKVEEIFFDKAFATNELVDLVYKTLLKRESKLRFIRVSRSAKSYNMKDVLNLIACPTLLIWGSEDTITPPRVARDFKKYIKSSRLEFINKCCHAPMMEYPDIFSKMVSDFLCVARNDVI